MNMKKLLDKSIEDLKERELKAKKEDNQKAMTYITEDWEADKISVNWKRFYEENFDKIHLSRGERYRAERLSKALEDLLIEAGYLTQSEKSYCINVSGMIRGSELGWDFADLNEAEKFINAKYKGAQYSVEVIQRTGRYKKNE